MDSVNSDQSESILLQTDNRQNELNATPNLSCIRPQVSEQYRDIYSTPSVTLSQDRVSHTSTPSIRPVYGMMSTSPVPVPFNVQMSIIDMNNQIAGLREISRSLQEQLKQINVKIDSLLQRSADMQTIQSPNVVSQAAPDCGSSQHVTVNSSCTTFDDQGTAPGNDLYSDVVKITPSRDTVPATTSRSKSASERVASKKTLLIGDSILKGINQKGLKNNTECHYYPGATIDILCDKIKIFNLTGFSNLVIYVGGNNAAQNSDSEHYSEYFEERLEQLIQYIKGVNQECRIYLCNMCPRGDTNVADINDVILRQCRIHNVNHIDTYKGFFDKHNQLRSHFYQVRDNVHLSRAGTRRLLGLISNEIPVVDNFEYCAYTDRQPLVRITNRVSNFARSQQRNEQSEPRSVNPTGAVQSNNVGNDSYQHRRPRFRTRYRNRNAEDRFEDRCMKCGLKNHTTAMCHHRNQLQCHSCSYYGHKTSICWNI